jgi:hypothetical protein
MRLFAVRVIEDKQAVGFFWTPDLTSLWWMIDSVCDPGGCEYRRIKDKAAIVWSDRVKATLGAGGNDSEEDGSEDSELLTELREKIQFDFSFEDYVYGEVEGWTKVPFADEPGGGVHEIYTEDDN